MLRAETSPPSAPVCWDKWPPCPARMRRRNRPHRTRDPPACPPYESRFSFFPPPLDYRNGTAIGNNMLSILEGPGIDDIDRLAVEIGQNLVESAAELRFV